MRYFLLFLLFFVGTSLAAAPVPPAKAKFYAVLELKQKCSPEQGQLLFQHLKTYAKTQTNRKKAKAVNLRQADKTRRYLVLRTFDTKEAARAYAKQFSKSLDKPMRKQLKKGIALEKSVYKARKKQRKLR